MEGSHFLTASFTAHQTKSKCFLRVGASQRTSTPYPPLESKMSKFRKQRPQFSGLLLGAPRGSTRLLAAKLRAVVETGDRLASAANAGQPGESSI